jgi:hypothetical protein
VYVCNWWVLSILRYFCQQMDLNDRLCGLVVRVPDYRSRGPGFNSWCYQIFWEVVGLEWGPLSLMSTTEELLENSSGSGLEIQEYGCGNALRWPCDTLSPQKLQLTSLTSGSPSVGIVCSQTKATELMAINTPLLITNKFLSLMLLTDHYW